MDSDGEERSGRSAQVAPVPGTVLEVLPSALYRVRLDAGPAIMAHVTGRIDRNFIRLLVGDRVMVEMSPVDAGRGRVTEKI